MTTLPERVRDAEVRRLLQDEAALEASVQADAEAFSGLKDIDAVLVLARTRLSLCLRLMRTIASSADPAEREELRQAIAGRGRAALRAMEALVAENISEDQRGVVQGRPPYAEARAALEEFLVAGGGGFLEAPAAEARKARRLARYVAASVRKYRGEDDRSPAMDLERLPRPLRRLMLFLFPVFMRENPGEPPWGIAEGEETVEHSRAMKLPLSQAIFYLENELLPGLEAQLREAPGTAAIQAEIRRVRERVEDYRKMRFFPRSTPVLLEQGFYTDGMTGYTADGEMLVPIPLAVSFRSGTNLDRRMVLVRMDLVRRVAGRGVNRALDDEYRRLRRIESGTRGSSRTASMKLDTAWGYGILKSDFPFLRRLTDKAAFTELEGIVLRAGVGAEERVEALIASDGPGRPQGPALAPGEREGARS